MAKLKKELYGGIALLDDGQAPEPEVARALVERGLAVETTETSSGYALSAVGRKIAQRLNGNQQEEELVANRKGRKSEKKAKREEDRIERLLAERDADLADKYPHYVKGSVRKESGMPKLIATIKCGECGKEREVFTSDIFQVKTCLDCKVKVRQAKRTKKARKSKKGK